jgi:hypothetical protein
VAGVARTGGVALVVGGVVVAGGLAIGVVRFAGGQRARSPPSSPPPACWRSSPC